MLFIGKFSYGVIGLFNAGMKVLRWEDGAALRAGEPLFSDVLSWFSGKETWFFSAFPQAVLSVEWFDVSFMSPFPTIVLSLPRVIAFLPGERVLKLLISSSYPETFFGSWNNTHLYDDVSKAE